MATGFELPSEELIHLNPVTSYFWKQPQASWRDGFAKIVRRPFLMTGYNAVFTVNDWQLLRLRDKSTEIRRQAPRAVARRSCTRLNCHSTFLLRLIRSAIPGRRIATLNRKEKFAVEIAHSEVREYGSSNIPGDFEGSRVMPGKKVNGRVGGRPRPPDFLCIHHSV